MSQDKITRENLATQLSEEFGVPIERKMDNPNGGAKVAYYRLGEDYETDF